MLRPPLLPHITIFPYLKHNNNVILANAGIQYTA